jgi:hypothetical protein
MTRYPPPWRESSFSILENQRTMIKNTIAIVTFLVGMGMFQGSVAIAQQKLQPHASLILVAYTSQSGHASSPAQMIILGDYTDIDACMKATVKFRNISGASELAYGYFCVEK